MGWKERTRVRRVRMHRDGCLRREALYTSPGQTCKTDHVLISLSPP